MNANPTYANYVHVDFQATETVLEFYFLVGDDSRQCGEGVRVILPPSEAEELGRVLQSTPDHTPKENAVAAQVAPKRKPRTVNKSLTSKAATTVHSDEMQAD